jgi:hypothetical protein
VGGKIALADYSTYPPAFAPPLQNLDPFHFWAGPSLKILAALS